MEIRSVNFIADPWEWFPAQPLDVKDRESWETLTGYKDFRRRLHWLLLWYDQVRFLDTFPLFNRQIEQWFMRAHDAVEQRERLTDLFREGAIRVVLRSSPTELPNLIRVDERDVRGKDDFIWYPDGPPDVEFVHTFNKFLEYHNATHDLRYAVVDHVEQIRNNFQSALTAERANFNLKPPIAEQLFQLLDNGAWRRPSCTPSLGTVWINPTIC